uniref:Transmembrane protein 119b n=1 Tax=Salmo trutta TaxID=8032 RepID=A0A674EVH5_SALTR
LPEMTFLMALHLISLSVMLWSSSPSLATPLPFTISFEGSAEEEELGSLIPTPSSPTTSDPASESPTTSDGSTHIEHFLLSQIVHFLQENMLLILVASILFITIFLILCCACIMSRKRKVNAYYPSSFPSKMYNLRTPSKPPLGEREGNNPTQIAAAAEKSPDVNVQAEGEIIEKDNEPSNAPDNGTAFCFPLPFIGRGPFLGQHEIAFPFYLTRQVS